MPFQSSLLERGKMVHSVTSTIEIGTMMPFDVSGHQEDPARPGPGQKAGPGSRVLISDLVQRNLELWSKGPWHTLILR